VITAEVQAESQCEPVPALTAKREKSQKPLGRQELPADLLRVERVIGCSPEQCACPSCGQRLPGTPLKVSDPRDS
jgi:hypothetical protein